MGHLLISWFHVKLLSRLSVDRETQEGHIEEIGAICPGRGTREDKGQLVFLRGFEPSSPEYGNPTPDGSNSKFILYHGKIQKAWGPCKELIVTLLCSYPPNQSTQ
ncbi:hypothetical protein CEXT_294621 [Caerostris extrusa]|uniref:Peptidylprolyl isomerase n=1 Tax=Caerostris extrusa TaxID=172846 RepID=A0AAV4RUS5_CAEEX|nr:hypothetical protein CEXT_294621 [Caerostris extrusa]